MMVSLFLVRLVYNTFLVKFGGVTSLKDETVKDANVLGFSGFV